MSTEKPATEPKQRKKRIGVLISGGGSNMLALVAASMSPDYPARIVQVLSDKADAGGIPAAKDMGIDARVIARKDYDSKQSHEAAMLSAMEEAKLDFVCLAGYMRLVSAKFVSRWQGKMINIHPSLLPLFPGLHTHERAIEAGVKVHGCSVHFVTEGMDEGPIIAQGVVPVLHKDTPDALAKRVLKVEHQIYPKALEMLTSGQVRMSGNGKAVFSNAAQDGADQLIA